MSERFKNHGLRALAQQLRAAKKSKGEARKEVLKKFKRDAEKELYDQKQMLAGVMNQHLSLREQLVALTKEAAELAREDKDEQR